MMMWHSGHGWGWYGVIVNVPTMAAFWGAVLTAIVLATVWPQRRKPTTGPGAQGVPPEPKACRRHTFPATN